MPNPDCPQCGGNRTYETETPGRWRCHNCDAFFEPDDEGGDYSSKDPSWRLEREEARQQREKKRRRQLGRRGGRSCQ